MKKFNKSMFVGLIIELIAGAIITIMVLAKVSIPDVIVWIFGVGLIITLASCVVSWFKIK